MGDRHSRVAASFVNSRSNASASRSLPGWVFLSLTVNGFLLVLIGLSVIRLYQPSLSPPANATASQVRATPPTQLGARLQLNYNEWVNLLAQEAQVVAVRNPDRLTILAGDSLSLWFPSNLLLPDRSWLNQGISGETSAGLLRRLELLDRTNPETIFVMIGINDLIRGVDDRDILSNSRKIIRYLKMMHPRSQIVVQSILPHADQQATWEGRDRLLAVPNDRIHNLNRQLQAIASREKVYFLDLYPLFADERGNLQMTFSTDGLHLNSQGYLVWSTALELYDQLELSR